MIPVFHFSVVRKDVLETLQEAAEYSYFAQIADRLALPPEWMKKLSMMTRKGQVLNFKGFIQFKLKEMKMKTIAIIISMSKKKRSSLHIFAHLFYIKIFDIVTQETVNTVTQRKKHGLTIIQDDINNFVLYQTTGPMNYNFMAKFK